MCTVTIIPLTGGFRLACNRDEAVTRPASLAPSLRRCGGRQAVYPEDPVSGGTWVAANDAGLAMVLLNLNERTAAGGTHGAGGASRNGPFPQPGAGRQPPASRGRIIPSLLECSSVEEARARTLARIDPGRHEPFRLVIADDRFIATVVSNGRQLRSSTGPLGRRPWMFTSSGLGDQTVLGPRTRLFEALMLASSDPVRAQDAFHSHSWADRPHISVVMRRPGARTVSCTVIERRGDDCIVAHWKMPPMAVKKTPQAHLFQEITAIQRRAG
jgi:hypothetical protein